MKVYITFGQNHSHRVNGVTLDKDSIAVIDASSHEEGRNIAFELFGTKFATSYDNVDDILHYFPRGLIEIN